jgi:hypothetical protein
MASVLNSALKEDRSLPLCVKSITDMTQSWRYDDIELSVRQ